MINQQMLVSFMPATTRPDKSQNKVVLSPEGDRNTTCSSIWPWCSMTAHTTVGVGLRNHVSLCDATRALVNTLGPAITTPLVDILNGI